MKLSAYVRMFGASLDSSLDKLAPGVPTSRVGDLRPSTRAVITVAKIPSVNAPMRALVSPASFRPVNAVVYDVFCHVLALSASGDPCSAPRTFQMRKVWKPTAR